jgi:hypothetical protein
MPRSVPSTSFPIHYANSLIILSFEPLIVSLNKTQLNTNLPATSHSCPKILTINLYNCINIIPPWISTSIYHAGDEQWARWWPQFRDSLSPSSWTWTNLILNLSMKKIAVMPSILSSTYKRRNASVMSPDDGGSRHLKCQSTTTTLHGAISQNP